MSDGKSTSRIVAAAIRWKGVTYTGTRHGYIIKQLVELGQLVDMERDRITDKQQGFVDSDNMFHDRDTAKVLAVQWGQLPESHKGTLYSEDLW